MIDGIGAGGIGNRLSVVYGMSSRGDASKTVDAVREKLIGIRAPAAANLEEAWRKP